MLGPNHSSYSNNLRLLRHLHEAEELTIARVNARFHRLQHVGYERQGEGYFPSGKSACDDTQLSPVATLNTNRTLGYSVSTQHVKRSLSRAKGLVQHSSSTKYKARFSMGVLSLLSVALVGCGMVRIPLDTPNGVSLVPASGASQGDGRFKNAAMVGRSTASMVSNNPSNSTQNISSFIP